MEIIAKTKGIIELFCTTVWKINKEIDKFPGKSIQPKLTPAGLGIPLNLISIGTYKLGYSS